MRMCLLATMVAAIMAMGTTALGTGSVADFDDLSLAAESYWNGSDSSGGFASGSASFNNSFTDWGDGYISWEGFAYSNLSGQEDPASSIPGQYTAIVGSGQSPANYAIGYVGWAGLPSMTLNQAVTVNGAYFTNNYAAYYSILNGDWVAKKFGGGSGDDADWFLLTIEGFDGANDSTGTVEFYLADYRFENDGLDYIVDEWSWVDLSGLGEVKKVSFSLSSSDNDPTWGMNTPAYFAMDTVVTAPEPGTCMLMGIAAVALLCRKR